MQKNRYLLIICMLASNLVGAQYNLSQMVKEGVELKRYCKTYQPKTRNRYAKWFEQDQVRQTIATNLQYFLLEKTIEHISGLAKKLEVSETDYKRMTRALVNQSCSPNLTVVRPEKIIENLHESYSKNNNYSFEASKEKLGISVNRFKQICSWNGKTDNYRMLSWFLSDHFVFSWFLKASLKNEKMALCRDGICEITNRKKFSDLHPLTAGSPGWNTDWKHLYCTYFKFNIHDDRAQPSIISKWIKNFFPNRTLYLADLISHLSKEPIELEENGIMSWDAIVSRYSAQIEKDWKSKSDKVLQDTVGYMSHEEPLLLVPVKIDSSKESIIDNELIVDVMVTAGELDKSLGVENKMTVDFSIKFPQSFFHWTKRSFTKLSPKEKIEFENLKIKLKKYYVKKLQEKRKLFTRAPWETQLPDLLVDITAKKLLLSKLKRPNSAISKQWADITVKMHFGLFALKHLYEMGPEFGRNTLGIKFKRKKHF